MSNPYFRIRIHRVTETLEDIITTQAIEMGSTGVSEALNFSQPDLTFDPDIIHSRFREIDVFFEAKPSEDFFRYLKELDPQLSWEVHEEQSKDWLEEWKKGFQAFRLVSDVWVIPSWLQPPAECRIPLYIDPGMAFGTGTHATTQVAAFLIHRLVRDLAKTNLEISLLDVGTGTAILAMLARKIGVSYVTGLEIDPEARRTARQNVERNELNDIDISDKMLEETRSQFDIVVANIIDGVLIQLKNDLFRVVKPGSYMVLSGILQERDTHFFDHFLEGAPVKVLRRIEKDEWVGYLIQKVES